MSSLGISGLLGVVSLLFSKLPLLVLFRMAEKKNLGFNGENGAKESRGWGRWRGVLLVLWVLSGVIGSLWFFCASKDFSLWRGNEKVKVLWEEKAEVLREQFNLSESQLQALALLFSSSDQMSLERVGGSMNFHATERCQFIIDNNGVLGQPSKLRRW